MRPQDTQMASGRDTGFEDDHLAELAFFNRDAVPKVSRVKCTWASVPDIMRWYGSHYSGDRYYVTFGDQWLQKDINGELLP